ncbi:MAG: cation diffusion facilitator family transporter [Drouetiella hepatica Uher 2000/2452]|jgi:cobalt-zinc-cadmium efflux system protein|uniref:Cation diffusion facilitator family transporter n=1 Tax=Drouetiella hepatica Uher 2000/2452 TaxID=904376 RepID=A0A951QD16_9CYAN|nr:cation diffusion facilitator family transporter [Drouetiella hepatica Uher 2000/2452]
MALASEQSQVNQSKQLNQPTTPQANQITSRILNSCQCGLLHFSTAQRGDPAQSGQKIRRLWMALGLLSGLFVTQVLAGLWSHSLSLLADSGHILSDVAVFGLTLAASYLAQRPASGRVTFGYGRVEVLVALVNGLSLLAIAAFIVIESVDRLQSTEAVLGLPMLFGSGVGLIINGINIGLLYSSSRQDLNMRSAFLHVAADAASSVSIVFASLMIYFWHWMWVDAATSLLIASLTCLSAIPLIKESLEVFLEFSPRSLQPEAIKSSLQDFDAVEEVEKLYIWSITPSQVKLCADLRVSALSADERDQLVGMLQTHLNQVFGIEESMLQILEKPSGNRALHPLLHRSLTSYVFENTQRS